MNRSPQRKGESLPRAASLTIGLIFLTLISAAMPFAVYPAVSGCLLVACTVFLFISAEKKLPVAFMLFAAFAMLSTDKAFTAAALALAVVSGTAVLARLLDLMKLPLAVAVPMIASVGAAIITKQLIPSLLPLSFTLPALALSYTFKKKEKRVSAICLTSAAVLFTGAVIVFAGLLVSKNGFDISALKTFTESMKTALSEHFLASELTTPKGETVKIFTERDAGNIAEALVSLLPAFIIIGGNAVAFFSQRLLYNMALRAGEEKRFTGEMVALILTPVAGVTFILSFFISTLTALSSDNALITTVFDNIFIILLPGLAASGIMFKVAKIAHTRRGGWIIVPFALLAFINISAVILLAAGMGAYYSIANPLSAYLRSRED